MVQENYISGPDRLQCLTNNFRSSLNEWHGDEHGEIVIDGQERPLLSVGLDKLLEYVKEYTEIWKAVPENQKQEFKNIWFIDCRDLYISFLPTDICSDDFSIQDWAPVQFDYSVIETSFPFLSGAVFLTDASFYSVQFRAKVYFNESKFFGNANFDKVVFSHEASFVNCEFRHAEGISFQQTQFFKAVDFSNSNFNRAPLFNETKFSQFPLFKGVTFSNNGKGLSQREMFQDMIAWRTLKNISSSYKDQPDEARFFALEQRYYRKICLALRLVWQKESYATCRQGRQGLGDLFILDTWHWSSLRYWRFCFIRWNFIEWLISWFYDLVSEYGSSPSRAIFCFLGINILFCFLYRIMFDLGVSGFCFGENEGAYLLAKEHPASFFMLQNLFSPSAILSHKALIATSSPLVLALAIIQFCSAYLVLILAALAIRTRFQKN